MSAQKDCLPVDFDNLEENKPFNQRKCFTYAFYGLGFFALVAIIYFLYKRIRRQIPRLFEIDANEKLNLLFVKCAKTKNRIENVRDFKNYDEFMALLKTAINFENEFISDYKDLMTFLNIEKFKFVENSEIVKSKKLYENFENYLKFVQEQLLNLSTKNYETEIAKFENYLKAQTVQLFELLKDSESFRTELLKLCSKAFEK